MSTFQKPARAVICSATYYQDESEKLGLRSTGNVGVIAAPVFAILAMCKSIYRPNIASSLMAPRYQLTDDDYRTTLAHQAEQFSDKHVARVDKSNLWCTENVYSTTDASLTTDSLPAKTLRMPTTQFTRLSSQSCACLLLTSVLVKTHDDVTSKVFVRAQKAVFSHTPPPASDRDSPRRTGTHLGTKTTMTRRRTSLQCNSTTRPPSRN
jgi:hypothetical protein